MSALSFHSEDDGRYRLVPALEKGISMMVPIKRFAPPHRIEHRMRLMYHQRNATQRNGDEMRRAQCSRAHATGRIHTQDDEFHRPYASMHMPIKLTIIDLDLQNSSHAIPLKYIADPLVLLPPKKNLTACCTPMSITTPMRKKTCN